MHRSKQEQEKLAEQNRSALQRSEKAALVLLLVRRNSAVRTGISLSEPIAKIADRVEQAVRGSIKDLRRLSEIKGLERLRIELDSLGIDIGKGRLTQAQADMLLQDTVRARLYAKS